MWEFTPTQGSRYGGTLFSDFGQLRSRFTGSCLRMTYGDQPVTTGSCTGGREQAWRATDAGGGAYRLYNKASGYVGYTAPGCQPTVGIELSATGGCGLLRISADSYRFRTDPIKAPGANQYAPRRVVVDPQSYSCSPGYTRSGRPTELVPDPTGLNRASISANLANPQQIPTGSVSLVNPTGRGVVGQLEITCVPIAGNPELGPDEARWSFGKIGAPGQLTVEVNGAAGTNGTRVDVWQRTVTDGELQANQRWSSDRWARTVSGSWSP